MATDKDKILETSLVLTTGFLVVYFVTQISFILYVSLAFGIIGIFIKPLAKIITIAWFKLADALNYVFSKLVLGTLFFLVLFPISVMYRLTNKDKLHLKNRKSSYWFARNKKYESADLENIW